MQSSLAAPSSPKNGGASPGKAATKTARLPSSVAISSGGPSSLAGASPGAPSAAASGFPPLVPTLSFKEVASRQRSLSGLLAAVPKVATLQGHPSGLHAVVPEAPAVSIPMPQEALTHARHYSRHALVCRFNGFWPSLPDLISWFSSEWYPLLDGEVIPYPCAKGFFVVVFYSTSDRDKVFNSGPWFWGRAGLSMQHWTPAFDPSTDCISSAPVWVRLPYFPLHFWGDESLHSIGNGLGKFLCRSPDSKPARSTFTRICVEMDFSKGFPAEIILQGKDYSRTQKLDYENLSFRCRNCFETGHLARHCGKPPGKKRSSKPTWWTGVPMVPRPESKTPEEAEEAEVEDEIKPPSKGEAEDSPKSPTQQDPLASSWADLADKEEALGPSESHSIDHNNEWQTVSKRKKNFHPRSDVMTRSRSGSLK
jgi:hypothetical protein